MSGTLRNGVPLEVVEELLDLTRSIGEAADHDARVNEAAMWTAEFALDGEWSNAESEAKECLSAVARGWTDKAKRCLERMRECVRQYYGSVQ